MQIVEVLNRQDKLEFHNFPRTLYKNDPFWICPLDSMIEDIFDPLKNLAFKNGEAVRWLLKDNNGNTIGRIAAFIDRVKSATYRQPTGGCGFFEVIDDREAAYTLFDTARRWLAHRGMEAMDGPINFGRNDNYWGLLVDGFVQQGFGMPYNKKYYRSFFEDYGFKNYYNQYTSHRILRDENNKIIDFPERIMKIAEWLTKRPGYSFLHFKFRDSRKFINDLCSIYNSTWNNLKAGFTPIDPFIMYEAMHNVKHIIDEELIWFAYYNDKPIGFFILLPDFNQILRHLNGKLNLWNIIRVLYYKMTREMKRMRAVVGGVLYSHQNTGVESAIFFNLYHVFKRKPWLKELEISWVGDYNPKMMAIYEALGAKIAKTHITYRYLINEKLPFSRYKDEMAERQENEQGKNTHDQ